MAKQDFSKLSVLLLFNTEQFEQSLDKVQRKMRASGRAMANVGRDMSIGVSLPLALAAKGIVETATEFEYQMARVRAISGASSRSFGLLTQNAEELGATTIFTATAVGQLQEEFAKLGFTASEITAVTESTLSLAQVTGADLGRAAEIAGSTLRTFGLDVSQVGRVNDIVATAISRSALDFEAFAETMKFAGSEAALNGISIEELSAAMGVLANRGVKGSIAGTRLRMIFSRLAKEGGNVHEKFLDLINGNVTMTEAIARFGVRAAAAVPVLQQNRDEFFALETAMIQSAGTLSGMQKIMDDTSFSTQRRLVSALEDLAIQFGKVLLPIVNMFLEVLIGLVAVIADLPSGIKVIVAAIGTALIVLPPVVFLLGTLRVRFVELMQLSPKIAAAFNRMFGIVGIVIGAIVALGLHIFELSQRQRGVISMTERLNEANTQAAEAAGKVLQPIRRLIVEYGNEATSLERRKEILGELERAQPDYFKGLDSERTTIQDLKADYDRLSTSIINNAKARAFQAKITEIGLKQQELIGKMVDAEIELEDIDKRAAAGEEGFAPREQTFFSEEEGSFRRVVDPKFIRKKQLLFSIEENKKLLAELDSQTKKFLEKALEYGLTFDEIFGKPRGGGGDGGDGTESQQSRVMKQLAKDLALADAEVQKLGATPLEDAATRAKAFEKAFRGLISASVDGEDVSSNLADVTASLKSFRGQLSGLEEEAKGIEAFSKSMEKLSKSLRKVSSITSQINENQNLDTLKLQLRDLQQEYRKLGDSIREMDDAGNANEYILDRLKSKYADLGKSISETSLKIAKLAFAEDLATEGALSLGEAMGGAMAKGENVAQAALASSAETLASLVREIYLLYAIDVIRNKGLAGKPLAKLALLGVGAGIISGFLKNIPKLAQGGIAVGSQLAVVGDNRSGREAIIPLEKLPGLMQKMGGGSNGRLYGTIEGYDLVLTNERNNRFLQRQTR